MKSEFIVWLAFTIFETVLLAVGLVMYPGDGWNAFPALCVGLGLYMTQKYYRAYRLERNAYK